MPRNKATIAIAIHVVAAGIAAAAAVAAGAPYTAKRTSTCLNARKVLTSAVDRTKILPPGMKPLPVAQILVGFPFAPGKAKVDSAAIAFMTSPSVAANRLKAILAFQYASAATVKGISREQARAQIRRRLVLKGNAIVGWKDDPQPSSRRAIAACLS
jgi:hypothetical protein